MFWASLTIQLFAYNKCSMLGDQTRSLICGWYRHLTLLVALKVTDLRVVGISFEFLTPQSALLIQKYQYLESRIFHMYIHINTYHIYIIYIIFNLWSFCTLLRYYFFNTFRRSGSFSRWTLAPRVRRRDFRLPFGLCRESSLGGWMLPSRWCHDHGMMVWKT